VAWEWSGFGVQGSGFTSRVFTLNPEPSSSTNQKAPKPFFFSINKKKPRSRFSFQSTTKKAPKPFRPQGSVFFGVAPEALRPNLHDNNNTHHRANGCDPRAYRV
jgi:hypothetical protein